MKRKSEWRVSTLCVHGGDYLDEATGATTTPIFQASTFLYPRERVRSCYIYSRWSNPTVEAAERKIALLEGVERALPFSSGMAAVSSTIFSLMQKGDHLISIRDLFGATYTLFTKDLPRRGIEVTFIDPQEIEQLNEHIRPNTKLVYLESPTNPLLKVCDFPLAAEIAMDKGITTVIDSTFATPINQQPLRSGIDIVIHSGSKYLNGHSDLLAGAVVGREEIIEGIYDERRILGGALDPHAAYMLLRGMKTLHLRMMRHNENGMALAAFLEENEAVDRVYYPGLESQPQHALARKTMKGFGGMLSFEVKGGRRSAEAMLKRLKIIKVASSLGGVESLITMPIQTSHVYLSPRERQELGIKDNLVRLSLGIEDPEDLREDLSNALKGSK